jgi:hypothetical protein
MSWDEDVGAQSQCAGCDQARSCWIRDTLEGRDAPEPSIIAVEERYVERAEAGDCVFFRRPKSYISYKSAYDARRDDPMGKRRAEGVTDYKYTAPDEPRGWF